jgi:hypothetical protein
MHERLLAAIVAVYPHLAEEAEQLQRRLGRGPRVFDGRRLRRVTPAVA